MIKRLTYLYPDTDRHGNQRLYFKPPGWPKKVRIRHASGSKEAKAQYDTLYKMWENGDMPVSMQGTEAKPKAGSIKWLSQQYMASGKWRALADKTKLQRKNFYDRFNRVHGSTRYHDLTSKDLAATRDALPRFAGRNFIKAMRALFKWACSEEEGLADHNPAAAVSLPSGATRGHTKWTLDDVMKFRDHYPKYSTPRKALACLIFTAREISGVRELGRGEVRDGYIRGYRKKTWADATTPVLNLLKDELGSDYDSLVWIARFDGKPYSDKSLSQKFSSWARDAGLPGLTAHGLRKSVGTILADLGFSENTIMAVLSHDDASSAQVYVQEANRKRLATQGMQAFEAEISHIWKVGSP